MAQIKILHLNFAKGFRGGERQTELLITALAKLNVAQTLLVRHDSPLIARLSAVANLTVHSLRKPYIGKLASKVAAAKYDFLHAHETKAAQWALLHATLYNSQYIITRRVAKTPKKNIFTRNVYQRAAITVCLSAAIEKNLLNSVAAAPVTIIPSMCAHLAVDKQAVAEIKSGFKGKTVIGHIGALDESKGQSYLLKAFKSMADKQDYALLFLGEGKDKDKLQAVYNEPNVHWLGFVANVADYIQAMDLFVFPSLEEGLGSTLLDVMEQGVPIIASDVGGIPDVIKHASNGLLVPAANSQAIAQAIKQLLGDANLRQQLVQQAKKDVANYTPAVIGKRYLNLYNKVLKEKNYE